MNNKLRMAILVLLLTLNVTNISDKIGHDYFNKSIKNAAKTYLIARGINGVISLVQDAEVTATPAGVGVSISPGEILDPLNDLIEEFSGIMLLATASLGVQKLLIVFSGWWGTKLIISLLLVSLLLSFSLKENLTAPNKINKAVIYKSLILILSVRFILPFIAVSSSFFESIFLNDPMSEKIASLQVVEQLTSDTTSEEDIKENGWFSDFKKQAKELGEFKEKTAHLKEKLSNSVDNIIDLIALFMIQTIILPLAFLYIMLKLIKHTMGNDYASIILGSAMRKEKNTQTPIEITSS